MRGSFNKGLKRTVYSNTFEGKVNPFKRFYAVIHIDGVNRLYEYESKFRSEATSYFNRIAKRNNGKVDTFSSFR